MHSMAARFLSQTGVMSSSTVGLPVALLGLVRLEQEHRRRAEHLLAGVVAVRLGDDARVLREIRRPPGGRGCRCPCLRVRQHKGRVDGAVDIHEPEERLVVERDGIVAEVPELDVGDAEMLGGGLGFLLPLAP